jgi:hypothetical protein
VSDTSTSAPIDSHTDAFDTRLNRIQDTIYSAESWRKAINRYRPYLIFLSLIVITYSIIIYVVIQDRVISAKNDQLDQIYRANAANLFADTVIRIPTPPESPRSPSEDVDTLAAARFIGHEFEPERITDRVAQSLYRFAQWKLDGTLRSLLSGQFVQILPTASDDVKGFMTGSKDVNCLLPGNESQETQLFGSERTDLGFYRRETVRDGNRTSAEAAWIPAWHDKQSNSLRSTATNEAKLWSLGSLVCLSPDSRWLLIWSVNARGEPVGPPSMRSVVWIGKSGRSRQYAQIGPYRLIVDKRSSEDASMLTGFFGNLIGGLKNNSTKVTWFRRGDKTGFLLAAASTAERTAVVWTYTGLLARSYDQDEQLRENAPDHFNACAYRDVAQADGRTRHVCRFERISLDGHRYQLNLQYVDRLPKEEGPWGEGIYTSQVDTEFPPLAGRGPPGPAAKIEIIHLSAPIDGIKIVNEYLWLHDRNNQYWRYTLGTEKMILLSEERLEGLAQSKIKYSPECVCLEKAN